MKENEKKIKSRTAVSGFYSEEASARDKSARFRAAERSSLSLRLKGSSRKRLRYIYIAEKRRESKRERERTCRERQRAAAGEKRKNDGEAMEEGEITTQQK